MEYGEPQHYCMEGGVERVESAPGLFRIRFTEAGSRDMAGIRAIEVDNEADTVDVPDMLDALDYIFHGLDGYTRSAEPNAAANSRPATRFGNSGDMKGPPSVS